MLALQLAYVHIKPRHTHINFSCCSKHCGITLIIVALLLCFQDQVSYPAQWGNTLNNLLHNINHCQVGIEYQS